MIHQKDANGLNFDRAAQLDIVGRSASYVGSAGSASVESAP